MLLRSLEMGGEAEGRAIEALLELGEPALDALVERFPGDVQLGGSGSMADASPVLRALAAFGRRAVPALTPLLHQDDSETRFYAAALLGELVYPEAAVLLGTRLHDPDPLVRHTAAQSLVRFKQSAPYANVLRDLLDALSGDDPQRRVTSAEAAGVIGEVEAVPLLARALGDGSEALRRTAHDALVAITVHDHGTDGDAWIRWYEDNRARHRLEWLIDGLVHEEIQVRISAIDELTRATGMTFGYEPHLEPQRREAIRSKFRAWWERSGRSEFQPAPEGTARPR